MLGLVRRQPTDFGISPVCSVSGTQLSWSAVVDSLPSCRAHQAARCLVLAVRQDLEAKRRTLRCGSAWCAWDAFFLRLQTCHCHSQACSVPSLSRSRPSHRIIRLCANLPGRLSHRSSRVLCQEGLQSCVSPLACSQGPCTSSQEGPGTKNSYALEASFGS